MQTQDQDRETLANAPTDQPLNDAEKSALQRELERERTQHTPGPWRVVNMPKQNAWHILDEGGFPRAEVYAARSSTQRRQDEAEANARLIAAAPELLQACKDVSAAYQEMFDSMPVAFQTFAHIVESAIARAEGQS